MLDLIRARGPGDYARPSRLHSFATMIYKADGGLHTYIHRLDYIVVSQHHSQRHSPPSSAHSGLLDEGTSAIVVTFALQSGHISPPPPDHCPRALL